MDLLRSIPFFHRFKSLRDSHAPFATLSIAIATYNGEKYLEDQLESLAEQTVLPDELVITDDGSTDKTRDIVESFRSRAPFPVHFHSNPIRHGWARNFFEAARLCSGSYIAFCDQDDIWCTEKIAAIRSILNSNQSKLDLIVHTCKLFYELEQDSDLIFPTSFINPGMFAAMSLDPFTIVPGHSIIARRELIYTAARLLELIPKNSLVNKGHDNLVYFLGAIAGTTYIIAKPLVLWRQHSSNTCGVPKAETNVNAVPTPHKAFLEFHSARWASLSQSLTALNFGTPGIPLYDFEKSANFYYSKSQYFASRSIVCDPSISLLPRILAFLRAHLLHGHTSGNHSLFVRALLRDIGFFIIPSKRSQ